MTIPVPKFCPTIVNDIFDPSYLAMFVRQQVLARGDSNETNSVTEPAPTNAIVTTTLLEACVPATTLHWTCVPDAQTVVAAAVPPTRMEFEFGFLPKELPTTKIDPVDPNDTGCALGNVGRFEYPILKTRLRI